MPWSALRENLQDAVKDKSLELRKLFVKTANAILEETGNETKAIQAGIAAVLSEENKKKKLAKAALDLQKRNKADELANYKPPAHLAALIQAANLKKQALLDQQEVERKKLQEIKDSILLQVKSDTAKSIVDMQVQGEDVLLIHKDGTKVKRKLADYTIHQQVVVTAGGQEPTFTNPNPSLGVGGIPSGSTFEEVPVTEMWGQLLYPFTAALAASPSLVEIGTTLPSITLSWNVSAPANLTLNQGIGDVTGETTYLYSNPTSSDITFVLTASKDGMTRTANASTLFKNRIITAVTPNLVPDDSELLAEGGALSDSYVRTVNYNCSGGNRFYIAYPSRLGAMSAAQVNNLAWNDWTSTTRSWTNSSGYTEDYIILVSNNLVYGASIPVKWGV